MLANHLDKDENEGGIDDNGHQHVEGNEGGCIGPVLLALKGIFNQEGHGKSCRTHKVKQDGYQEGLVCHVVRKEEEETKNHQHIVDHANRHQPQHGLESLKINLKIIAQDKENHAQNRPRRRVHNPRVERSKG